VVFDRPLQVTVRSMLSDRCLSCLSVTLVYCGQTTGWISNYSIPLGTGVCLGPGDIVLDGDPALPHGKGHSSPQFSAHVYCGQTVAHLSNCWALVLAFYRRGSSNTTLTISLSHCSFISFTSVNFSFVNTFFRVGVGEAQRGSFSVLSDV